MTTSLVQEAMNVVYVNDEPTFVIKGNGKLQWYRLTPAVQADMKDLFSARDTGNGAISSKENDV